VTNVTMKQLLEAGVHFGHQTRRWNPKMAPFLFGERNGIHIVDLRQTLEQLNEAYDYVKELAANGGTLMFVGTKKQAQAGLAEEAARAGMPYITKRWLGGMLTNFHTTHKRILYMRELERMDSSQEMDALPKKERIRLRRELGKLKNNLGGVGDLHKVPEALFIIDTSMEHIAVREAARLGIPIIAVVDTNCDPDPVSIVIPGNDDAIRAVKLFAAALADACIEGRREHENRSRAAREGADQAPADEAPADETPAVEAPAVEAAAVEAAAVEALEAPVPAAGEADRQDATPVVSEEPPAVAPAADPAGEEAEEETGG
jgi:small subunit ribosomal protein S2